MTTPQTPKEIIAKLIEIEQKLDLLTMKVDDVFIWQFLRVRIYVMLIQKCGTFKQLHTNANTFSKQLMSLGQVLYSTLFFNPYFSLDRKKILIFDHPRKVNIEGSFIDIYTKYLIEKYIKEHETIEVYEDPYLNKHHTNTTNYRKHTDIIWVLTKMFYKLVPLKSNKKIDSIIDGLEKEIQDQFGVNLELKHFFFMKAKQFKIRRYLLKVLLKIKKPDKIFLVVNYEYAALIAAAKSLNILTIELQHGVITTDHLGYSFPHLNEPLSYFPDQLYVWNDMWKSMPFFPIDSNNIINTGFAHLNAQKEKYSHENKDPKQILIISQGPIAEKLIAYLYKNRTFFSQYHLIFKLHPGEYDRWRSYHYLDKLKKLDHFDIIDNDKEPLYRLFARSNLVIGVYSTALYEALDMGCKLYILDFPGHELVENLISSGNAVLLNHDLPLKELP